MMKCARIFGYVLGIAALLAVIEVSEGGGRKKNTKGGVGTGGGGAQEHPSVRPQDATGAMQSTKLSNAKKTSNAKAKATPPTAPPAGVPAGGAGGGGGFVPSSLTNGAARKTTLSSKGSAGTFAHVCDDADKECLEADLRRRLVVRSADIVQPNSVAPLKQFFHLHHMKTGGTSFNSVMRCALDRSRQHAGTNATIQFTSISECSGHYFTNCMDGDEGCAKKIDAAAVMSYCAPLRAVDHFGWAGVDSFTVIRHPVDRVWSMYRFQTKSCYNCRKLSEIYEDYDAGKVNETDFRGICLTQILNHQTTNLLSTTESLTETHDEQMAEAVNNVKHGFTLIGLTHELPTMAKMVGKVFPWMAEADPWDTGGTVTSTTMTTRTTTTVTSGTTKKYYPPRQPNSKGTCPLPHANASPGNNRCGKDGGHMPLPDEPDAYTRKIIMDHNKQDMAVYNAAVEMFALQRKILEV